MPQARLSGSSGPFLALGNPLSVVLSWRLQGLVGYSLEQAVG